MDSNANEQHRPAVGYWILILLIAFYLRWDYLTASSFRIDADEAVVGLMARHVAAGGVWPVFYYGQHYMGSLEALCVAGLFRLFEGPALILLKLVPLVFSLVFVVLVVLLARELGGWRAGRYAGWVAAVPPATLLVWSTKARGGFIELLVIGTAALWCCCRWLKRPNLVGTALMGIILGIGWWVNNQIIYYMLPMALGVSGRLFWTNLPKPGRSRSLWVSKHLVVGAVAFLGGSLPYWQYNLQHGFASLGMFRFANGGDIVQHFTGLWLTAFPILLGAKRYWQENDLFPGSTIIVLGFYLVLLLAIYGRRGSSLLRALALKFEWERPLELILAFLVGTSAVFTLSSFGYLAQAPRYLLPMYSAVLVLVGLMAAKAESQHRFGGRVVLMLALGLNLVSIYWQGRAIPGEPLVYQQQRVAKDHQELIDWLDVEGISLIRTDYWIGYRLVFETEERVRFAVFGEPQTARIKQYEEMAREVGLQRLPFVLVPAQAEVVRAALETLGYIYSEVERSGYVVLYDIKPTYSDLKLLPADLVRLVCSDQGQQCQAAYDGDPTTRWGSGRPQQPGMTVNLRLVKPHRLRSLRYNLGRWHTDFPRNFEIWAKTVDGRRVQLLASSSYPTVRSVLENDTSLQLYFAPIEVKEIELHQIGEDPVFDWSIAELELWQ